MCSWYGITEFIVLTELLTSVSDGPPCLSPQCVATSFDLWSLAVGTPGCPHWLDVSWGMLGRPNKLSTLSTVSFPGRSHLQFFLLPVHSTTYNILSKDSRLQHLEGSANSALFGGLDIKFVGYNNQALPPSSCLPSVYLTSCKQSKIGGRNSLGRRLHWALSWM